MPSATMAKHAQARKNSKSFSIATLACTSKRPMQPLFEAILHCDWTSVYHFLTHGIWKTEDYNDSTMTNSNQCRVWATYYDSYSQQRLRQLPLHAAISHLAPLLVIQALIDLYPEAVRIADNQGNLPLHLAFATNAKDVSSFLLKVYPKGHMKVNQEGRVPIECYLDFFGSVMTEEEMQQELFMNQVEARDQKELEELELRERQLQQMRDHQIKESQRELDEIRMQLEKFADQGQRLIRSFMTAEEYRTGIVDL